MSVRFRIQLSDSAVVNGLLPYRPFLLRNGLTISRIEPEESSDGIQTNEEGGIFRMRLRCCFQKVLVRLRKENNEWTGLLDTAEDGVDLRQKYTGILYVLAGSSESIADLTRFTDAFIRLKCRWSSDLEVLPADEMRFVVESYMKVLESYRIDDSEMVINVNCAASTLGDGALYDRLLTLINARLLTQRM